MRRRIAHRTVKSGWLFNPLQHIRSQSAARPDVVRHEIQKPREVLNRGLRFPQGSNINSADGSCGELKAQRFGDFSCGKTRFFRGADVAVALLKIFLEFGAPYKDRSPASHSSGRAKWRTR
jgi:hypothetical protein